MKNCSDLTLCKTEQGWRFFVQVSEMNDIFDYALQLEFCLIFYLLKFLVLKKLRMPNIFVKSSNWQWFFKIFCHRNIWAKLAVKQDYYSVLT